MTKFHVNPNTLNIYKCTAQEGNCKYEQQYHADTIEEAQQIADKMYQEMVNNGELSMKRKPSELFNRVDMVKRIDKSKNRLKREEDRVKKLAKEKYKIAKKHGRKESFNSYLQFKRDDDAQLQDAIQYNKYVTDLANMYLNYREQLKEIENDAGNLFTDKSYSGASCSAYYMIKKEDVDKLKMYLTDNDYEFDIKLENSNQKFINIRISDHENEHNVTGYEINIKYKSSNKKRKEEEIIQIWEDSKKREEL